jgi:hypothetical protein
LLELGTYFLNMSNEIAFKFDLTQQVTTRADFTYKITPNTITITDTTLGKLSVTKDLDAVLRKIEHWHQGSIAAFKIMYRDEHGGLERSSVQRLNDRLQMPPSKGFSILPQSTAQ